MALIDFVVKLQIYQSSLNYKCSVLHLYITTSHNPIPYNTLLHPINVVYYIYNCVLRRLLTRGHFVQTGLNQLRVFFYYHYFISDNLTDLPEWNASPCKLCLYRLGRSSREPHKNQRRRCTGRESKDNV